jgi:hypothetical protein
VHSPVPSPSFIVCFDESGGETPAFAIYSKRPIELSKQLLTLVEKTQIFYLVKEFAQLFASVCLSPVPCPRHVHVMSPTVPPRQPEAGWSARRAKHLKHPPRVQPLLQTLWLRGSPRDWDCMGCLAPRGNACPRVAATRRAHTRVWA